MGATTSKVGPAPATTSTVLDEKRSVLDAMAADKPKSDVVDIGASLTLDVLDRWSADFEAVSAIDQISAWP